MRILKPEIAKARKEKILRWVVQQFVETRRPVGSQMIADGALQDVSSATIRNIMKELEEDPTPISGYYIPKDCERRFEHPVTGLEHLEYIEVALEAPRKYKVWPKGTLVSTREYYKPDYFEEQMELDELPFL